MIPGLDYTYIPLCAICIQQTRILQPNCYVCLHKFNIGNWLWVVLHSQLALLLNRMGDRITHLTMENYFQLKLESKVNRKHSLQTNNPAFDRNNHGLSAIAYSQFTENAIDMGFDSAFSNS